MEKPLDRVKALLAALPREDQEDLTRFLHDILVTPEEAEARHVASLQAEVGGKPVTYTFRTEGIRCGKTNCRCRAGQLHGPYTYKYWREGGRLRKAYVGKARLPGASTAAARPRDSSARSTSGRTPPAPTGP
ncbi:MAG: hypothetical protein QOE90_57 [Thermoplasmata archaeon]|jgi:hypothetical protein|nr:hypothetical protein [Thermoplasmata archaeon]